MLRHGSKSSIRGERPTCAVPSAVQKSLSVLRLATGRGKGTRLGPRGVSTKWSDRDELFRFPSGGGPERRTRPPFTGNVSPLGVVVGMQMGMFGDPWPCLVGSESKTATVVDRGNSHDVDSGMVRTKTGQYKQCEICSRRRWRGGLCRVFWRTQHLPDKARLASSPKTEQRTARFSIPRGVTVMEG